MEGEEEGKEGRKQTTTTRKSFNSTITGKRKLFFQYGKWIKGGGGGGII